MSAPFELVPREAIGLPETVTSSSGARRPKLILPAAYVTYHWTGVNVNYGDVGDTAAEIRAIESWARSAGKPFEYNYVNHRDPDNKIFEYAGEFRAAHSGGENSVAIGILQLLGVKETMTELMVEKLKWLNDVFRYFKMEDSGTLHLTHRMMPGAATSCAGENIQWWLPEFSKPHNPAPPPPPPPPKPKPPVPVPPPDSDRVGHFLIRDGLSPWGISSEAYGTGTRWPEIIEANRPDTTPNPLERWAVPGFEGQWTEVRSGEGPWAILNRLFGSGGWDTSTGVDQFWQWNGGDPATPNGRVFNGKKVLLQPGERVWVRN